MTEYKHGKENDSLVKRHRHVKIATDDNEEEESEEEKIHILLNLIDQSIIQENPVQLFEAVGGISMYINTELINYLIPKNLFTHLLNYVITDVPGQILDFLDILYNFSKCENSLQLVTIDLMNFLISLIIGETNNSNVITRSDLSRILEIFINFSDISPKIASKITQLNTINVVIDLLLIKSNDQNTDDDLAYLIDIILTFLRNLLNIEKFQPIDSFERIVDTGFKFLSFPLEDIAKRSLEIIYNASFSENFNLFGPYLKKKLNLLQQIFELICNPQFSKEALKIFGNITGNMNYEVTLKIFYMFQNDFIDTFSNALFQNPKNQAGICTIISNLLERRSDIKSQQGTPVLDYFSEFINFIILQSFNDEMKLNIKESTSHLFLVVTEISSQSKLVEYIHNLALIGNLCSIFGLDQLVNFNIICGLCNLLSCARNLDVGEYVNFVKFILTIIPIESFEAVFEEPEDLCFPEKLAELMQYLDISGYETNESME